MFEIAWCAGYLYNPLLVRAATCRRASRYHLQTALSLTRVETAVSDEVIVNYHTSTTVMEPLYS